MTTKRIKLTDKSGKRKTLKNTKYNSNKVDLVKGGIPQKRNKPKKINKTIIKKLKTEVKQNYKDHPRLQEALDNIAKIQYDPEYASEFDGSLFKGEHKEIRQARDKIDAFFKYHSDLY